MWKVLIYSWGTYILVGRIDDRVSTFDSDECDETKIIFMYARVEYIFLIFLIFTAAVKISAPMQITRRLVVRRTPSFYTCSPCFIINFYECNQLRAGTYVRRAQCTVGIRVARKLPSESAQRKTSIIQHWKKYLYEKKKKNERNLNGRGKLIISIRVAYPAGFACLDRLRNAHISASL